MKPNDCQSCNDSDCTAHVMRPDERPEDFADRQALAARMCQIDHKILVLSGKGGVGKSTVAVNLATSLAMSGNRVGLLDIDIHGPSVPKLLHLENTPITGTDHSLHPIRIGFRTGLLSVMSIGLLLEGKDDAVIWRGPMKHTVIKQFLRDVDWGRLDYLVVDSPPGTGDEPLAVAQLIEKADGAVVVTTPQEVAVQDVRRCITFCRQLDLPVLGVVENMSGFTCPGCGEHYDLFGAGGGRAMAADLGLPFLGAIPIDLAMVPSGDDGTPIVRSLPECTSARAFRAIAERLAEPIPASASGPEQSTAAG